MWRYAAVLGMLLWAFPSYGGDVLTVPWDYPYIMDAMDAAQAGDEILVSPGTYTDCTHLVREGSRDVLHCVIMKSGVILRSESGPEQTIIDAEQLGRVVRADSCEVGTRIEGFTLTGGKVLNPTYGAGLRSAYSQIELVNVVFLENQSTGNGGGSYVVGGNNNFLECVFSGNQSGYYGGGLYCIASDSGFERCRFTNNSAQYGGGVVCDFSPGIPTFDYCVIDHNQASQDGGGIWTSNSSPAVFNNCTISDNIAPEGASFYSLSGAQVFYCSILAFGQGPAVRCTGSASFECCDVYGHTGSNELCGQDLGGNFSLDPLFSNRESGQYEVANDSPCVPGNHPMGCNEQPIGAYPRDPTPTLSTSWGKLKIMLGK